MFLLTFYTFLFLSWSLFALINFKDNLKSELTFPLLANVQL